MVNLAGPRARNLLSLSRQVGADLKTIGEDDEASIEASRDADQLIEEGAEDEVRPG